MVYSWSEELYEYAYYNGRREIIEWIKQEYPTYAQSLANFRKIHLRSCGSLSIFISRFS